QLAVQQSLHFFYYRFNIAVPDVETYYNAALGIFAGNLHWSFFYRNGSYLSQWNLLAAWQWNEQVLHILQIFPEILLHPHDQVKSFFIFENHTGSFSCKSSAQHSVYIVNG